MQEVYNYQQNTIGTKAITRTFGLFIDLSASAQFIVQEEEEQVAAKVAVYNPRLVSI